MMIKWDINREVMIPMKICL